jgi:hypothetical protein
METVYDKLTCRTFDSLVDGANIRRFHSMNMKCQTTNADFHYGWNVTDVTFVYDATNNVSIGTFGASTSTHTISVGDILNPILMGRYYTDLYIGFEVCTVKGLHGITIRDLYPRFTYRKFGDDHK